MANLTSKYMGLELRNPLIISSSGLTNSAEKIKQLEVHGAGAVVLKSLFEEQIKHESGSMSGTSDYFDAGDYVMNYVRSHSLENYLNLIADAKKAVDIPVIASINCTSTGEWVDFAKEMENANADGIELNIYILPTQRSEESAEHEQHYYKIVEAVKQQTDLPVAVKIGSHFTNLLRVADQLHAAGADAIVLFNRFYEPDIDIYGLKMTAAEVFSSPADIRHALRWIGILSAELPAIDLSASTGIHDGKAVIKQLLAGAETTQICSTLYKNGIDTISKILEELNQWMDNKSYKDISDFRGKLNYGDLNQPAFYERSQFMKYFSSIE